MKLDRNKAESKYGGKYAIIRLRDLLKLRGTDSPEAIQVGELASKGFVEFATPGSKSEFFLIKLADVCAEAALLAYAEKAAEFDEEYAAEVRELASRAGPHHPNVKKPD